MGAAVSVLLPLIARCILRLEEQTKGSLDSSRGKQIYYDLDLHEFSTFLSVRNRLQKSAGKFDLSKNHADQNRSNVSFPLRDATYLKTFNL